MKINWLWDTRLTEKQVKRILKNPSNPRFYIYAEKLLSRTSDPDIALEIIGPKIFRREWPILKKRIQKDVWARHRVAFWQSMYTKMLKNSSQHQEIARQIRGMRLKRGYTQRDMAKKLGVIQQYVSKLETGRENITIDTLERIADVLDKNLVIRLV